MKNLLALAVFLLLSIGSASAATFQDFGAIGDGVTDDTIAVQAALSSGGLLSDDGKAYLISAPLVVHDGFQLEGVKARTKFIAASTFPANSDILTIAPLSSGFTECRGYKITDIRFESQTGSGHRHVIVLDVSQAAAALIADFHLSGSSFAATGTGFDVALAPHATDPNGFFCSTIAENVFTHGISLNQAGDSLNIQRNIFTGTSVHPGIWLDQEDGASNCVIDSNNFTCSGGAIYSQNSINLRILNNQIEQSLAYNGPLAGVQRACVYIAGKFVGGVWQKATLPIVRGNNVNTHNFVNACVNLVATDKAIIRENYLNQGTGVEVFTNGLDTGTLITDNK